jgi:hypothetical protein
MTTKPNRWFWSMKRERELMALAKTHTLIARQPSSLRSSQVGAYDRYDQEPKGEWEMTRNRSLLFGVGIGLFSILAVLTARYVVAVLGG